MAETLKIPVGASRGEVYRTLLPQFRSVCEGEEDLIANLANCCAILKEGFRFLWVGFYLRQGNELVLGPFQGPLACSRIQIGSGVCGTSAAERRAIVVPNVEEFPGHIACSSLSRSEVVVPLLVQDAVKLVLDIDSESLNDFSELDVEWLGQYLDILQRHFA